MKIKREVRLFILIIAAGVLLPAPFLSSAPLSPDDTENPAVQVTLTEGNLKETVERLEKKGMAGVFYAKINGKEVIKRAFGYADKTLGIRNEIDTIFGTGSRPIDYTVAAIHLLDQKGLLRPDDPVTRFFPDVPEDKRAMTIRHLLTGQSGLPDFFDTDEDWDPDLAWIDRDTAVKRLLSQKLLFPPGTNREHSHGAFGLLAAIIEKVTQTSYYSFIREHFLDPAGMTRTGEYGETRGLRVSDFAAGGGPQFIGLPNIPPNWGPTSWLVKGSGGMYSTLNDLLKFYRFIRSGKVLDKVRLARFQQPVFNVDGSDRGFELFSAFLPTDTEVYLFLNEPGDREELRGLFQALVNFVKSAK